jgi:hypothetical protein
MSSKILADRSKVSLLILASFSLLITIACKDDAPTQLPSNEVQNLQSTEIQNQIKIESVLTDETIEKDFVMILTKKGSPARIIDAVSVDDKLNFKKGAKIEIQNISGKTITSISMGFAPPVLCTEYMMVGDVVINNDEITKTNKIESGEKYFFYIPTDVAVNHLSPESFKTCPREYRKPMIYVWGVQFEDGESWDANNLEQKQN